MKKITFSLITLLFFLILFLAAAEWLLREKWTQPKERWDYSHPYIRRRVRAATETPYRADPLTGYSEEFLFKGGPIGYRTDSVLSREKNEGVYRIIFMGESTTACSYLPYEKTFPCLAENALNKEEGPLRFECADAGVDGASIRDSLALLMYDVAFANPDCIVLMHGINDLVAGLYPQFVPDGSDRLTAKTKARNLYEEWYGDSRPKVYHFYKSLRPQQSERFTLSHIQMERERNAGATEQEVTEFPNVRYFVQYLRMFVGACKGQGIRVILMTEPSLYAEDLSEEAKSRLWCAFHPKEGVNPSLASVIRGMQIYCQAVRDTASALEVELIDLEKEIPKTLDLLFDDVHYTVSGSEKVAEVVGSYLMQHTPEGK